MKNENQHIISQVYLRGFGYLNNKNQWMVSTLDSDQISMMESVNKKWICQKSIESFLSEVNIFDMVLTEKGDIKLYEKFNMHFENHYNSVISELENNKRLNQIAEVVLFGIVINLLIRTKSFRKMVLAFLEDERRDYFLNDIFTNIDEGDYLRKVFKKIPKQSELNFISIFLWDRIMSVFAEFHYVILETNVHEGWLTTDNPVLIKDNIETNTIFSQKSQLIFPINRQFLAYFFHPENLTIDLRGYMNKSLVLADSETKKRIINYIFKNGARYYIFPDFFKWE